MSAYSAAILALTPAAYYRGDLSGSDLADSSGNALHMGVGGTPTQVPGPIVGDPTSFGYELNSPNTDYYSHIGAAAFDVGDSFSIIAWIKRLADTGVTESIFTTDTAPTSGILFQINVADQLTLGESHVAYICTSVATIPVDGRWHMVGCTKNGATFELYVDGAASTTTILNQTIETSATADVGIGINPAAGQGCNAVLGEIALFNGVLSAANMLSAYQNGISGGGDDRRRRR